MKRLFVFVAVVKTRLQTIKKGEGEKNYKGIADCLVLVSHCMYIVDHNPVLSQSYADDLQAYVHCQAIETLQAWMSSNRLRLNPTKTQFIWFGTRQQLAKI